MIKLLVVDDHDLVRNGVCRLLDDVDTFKVVGEVSCGEEAISFVRRNVVDIVFLDLKMPGIGGLEATKRILRVCDGIKIIAFSAYHDHPFLLRILQAGAAGFLSKTSGVSEMIKAINMINEGHKYISPEIAQRLALKTLSDNPNDTCPFDLLSERELQVMMMITSGLKVQEISSKLCLSSKTVNSYRYRLFDKLKIKNDVELTHHAIKHGLLDKETVK